MVFEVQCRPSFQVWRASCIILWRPGMFVGCMVLVACVVFGTQLVWAISKEKGAQSNKPAERERERKRHCNCTVDEQLWFNSENTEDNWAAFNLCEPWNHKIAPRYVLWVEIIKHNGGLLYGSLLALFVVLNGLSATKSCRFPFILISQLGNMLL